MKNDRAYVELHLGNTTRQIAATLAAAAAANSLPAKAMVQLYRDTLQALREKPAEEPAAHD